MPKPIVVVNYCVSGIPMELAVRNLQSLKEVIEGAGVNEEYYTFVLPVTGDSHVQVFYDKDIDDNAFNNLRDLIDDRFKEFEEAIEGNRVGGDGLFEDEEKVYGRRNKGLFSRFRRR